MATVRGYMGVSLDQYIAAPGGSLDWLMKYDKADFGAHGYDRFIRQIRTVVMGRATYDWLVDSSVDWPYRDQRAIVVTSRPIDNPAGPLVAWSEGIAPLVRHMRGLADGDVWIVGGGRLQQAVIAEGGLDRLELFIVPEMVGGGVPLFPPNGRRPRVRLRSLERLDIGVVYLDYDFLPPDCG